MHAYHSMPLIFVEALQIDSCTAASVAYGTLPVALRCAWQNLMYAHSGR